MVALRTNTCVVVHALISAVLLVKSRYIVTINEKQATFTAKQQREGVCILPFIVAALLGRENGNPADDGNNDGASGPANDEPCGVAAGGGVYDSIGGPHQEEGGNGDDGGYDADEEEDVDALSSGFRFDRAAYRTNFGNTPMEDAVTATLAEYAAL